MIIKKLSVPLRSLLLGLAISVAGLGGVVTAAELTLVVSHPEAKGPVRLGVFDSEETFPDAGKQIANYIIPATGTQTTFTITVAPGTYAIALYLDQDLSEDLTYNFFGLPKEPIGFAKEKSGRPKWEISKFDVGDDPVRIETTLDFIF
ncbi:MAG: DUF2141 domain-containing protein [Alphaproteobacteria bacterium]|nr:DUF2141 domain-containing protein [Alphaproteobacteria bacterium]